MTCDYKPLFANAGCQQPATHVLTTTKDKITQKNNFCWGHAEAMAKSLRSIIPDKKRMTITATRLQQEQEPEKESTNK